MAPKSHCTLTHEEGQSWRRMPSQQDRRAAFSPSQHSAAKPLLASPPTVTPFLHEKQYIPSERRDRALAHHQHANLWVSEQSVQSICTHLPEVKGRDAAVITEQDGYGI